MISRANRVIAAAVTWLVIVSGCYFFGVARPELGTRWELLPPLPERAVSIEWTRFGFVIAHAEDGTSYMAYPGQDEPWTLYDATAKGIYGEPCEVNVDSRYVPSSPPGDAISQSNADCAASAESRYRAVVVLLENNEVWLWMYLYGGLGEAFAYPIVLAAGTLGVVLLLIGGVMKLYDAQVVTGG